jgi:FAD/FMN-containing dehydrogenase
VSFARENNIVLSIKGGGHNIAGNAVCEGGLMIDLSQMRGVEVDQNNRIARAGGGALLSDVDEATQPYGLVVPLGINSTTGIAGLTLGGGFGWLCRQFGLTIDNLVGATVVTADGSVLHASETENEDLFWGLRGGGGNFGIVTEFEFTLHEIGQTVMAGMLIFPGEDSRKVLEFYRDYMPNAPVELASWFVMRKAPPAPFVPEEWHGRDVIILAICATGPLDNAERLIQPLRDLGNLVADIVAPMPYVAWQKVLDMAQAAGARNYWKSNEFNELSDGLIDTFIEYARNVPDPNCDIAMAMLGGAVAKVPSNATAYANRSTLYAINIHGRWLDAAKDDVCIAWARNLMAATTKYSTGSVYVNFMTAEEGDRVRNAYGENYERLVALKTKYDPTNLFRMNQNIKPSTEHEVEGRG